MISKTSLLANQTSLQDLRAQIQACKNCPLNSPSSSWLPVPGEGSPVADLLLVGEGPGQQESDPELYDEEFGVPFVGPAGQLLLQLLTEAGWEPKLHTTFVTNVVKHRPPFNRTPTLVEQLACQHFLVKQIDIIKPKLIVGLGRVAADTLCRIANQERLGVFASQQLEVKGILTLTTFHPSYILRSPDKRNILLEDLSWAITTLENL